MGGMCRVGNSFEFSGEGFLQDDDFIHPEGSLRQIPKAWNGRSNQ
ncbi:MAG TPA: hypothetical protein PKD58_00785 [Candidatus Sumerlaeota bacterium]|nr:hypothetical protein [Candidatus Sumerlaeota bacterium]